MIGLSNGTPFANAEVKVRNYTTNSDDNRYFEFNYILDKKKATR